MNEHVTGRPPAGLAGLRVVVTAGAGGIGLAIASELYHSGCKVLVCDVDQDALARFSSGFPDALATRADVSSDVEVEKLFHLAQDAFGGLDALVNNAGIAGPTAGIDEIEPDEWRRTIDICLTGQFLCARSAVPLLKASGGGAIVNMSSSAGRFGYAYRTPYSAAKFGIVGLTLSLAKELGPSDIRVNAILPGIVAGDRMEGVIANRAQKLGITHEEMTQRYLDKISLRRMVEHDDISATTAFLLSRHGRNISGQLIGIDGNLESL